MRSLSPKLLPVLAATVVLAGCVSAPKVSEYRAPQPAKMIEAERLWNGRWLEIARVPDRLTDGCPAGASNYDLDGATEVFVRDTCERGAPGGSEKSISGSGRILDPGMNAKLRVRYLWGFVTWDYWVLDRADDYSWFISTDPTFQRLFIYTREVPSEAERTRLVERAARLGFDVSRLELPAHQGLPEGRRPQG